jgi:mannose-6-phosphate isomerase-like protein (cupin superfamily)
MTLVLDRGNPSDELPVGELVGGSDRTPYPLSDPVDFTCRQLLAVAESLKATALSWPGLADPTKRKWDLIATSASFEAWVIAWPSGGEIELHDHGGSAGVVVVVQGELVETSVSLLHGGVITETNILKAGDSVTMAPEHVHDIANLGEMPALSVHVYAPRLTTMTYYDIFDGRLRADHDVHYPPGDAQP